MLLGSEEHTLHWACRPCLRLWWTQRLKPMLTQTYMAHQCSTVHVAASCVMLDSMFICALWHNLFRDVYPSTSARVRQLGYVS